MQRCNISLHPCSASLHRFRIARVPCSASDLHRDPTQEACPEAWLWCGVGLICYAAAGDAGTSTGQELPEHPVDRFLEGAAFALFPEEALVAAAAERGSEDAGIDVAAEERSETPADLLRHCGCRDGQLR